MEKGLRTSLIFVIVFALAIGLVSAVEIGEDLHLNLQSTFSNGTIQSGTFEFYFNISTAENCGTVVYTNSTNLTTDTRGIISHYLPDVSLDYDQQYWLCYYKDGSLESSSKIARTPYSFGALNVSAEGVKNDSDLDLTNYNVTASWFRGIFDWIIGATSGNYLSFNGTQLDFDESALNTTIDARSGIFNDSINNYIAENNVSMNNWITANNGSVVNYISGVNTSNNNYIIDYVSVQNGSMTNYIATVNTSMGNYVVDYVGTQNASLVNYIGVVNTTRDNYVADSYVPYSGADKNVDLGANNFSVDNTLLFVDANNNLVGIGTTSPEALMHLQAASGWTELRLQGGDETSGGQIRFDNSTGMEIAEIYATPNDDSFRIQTGNSDRFTIDSSGNIGIGTTTPQNLLNVDGDLNATGIFYGNGSGLHSLSSSAIEDIWVNVSGDTMTGNLDLGDNNITNVDYLGIGTTTPLADLHINRSSGWAEARLQGGDETSGGTLSLYNNTGMELAEIYATPLDDSLRFQTGGSDRFTIDSAGQVGIGTSSPAEELDVRGAVQAQQIIANGTGTHPTGIGSYIELYMLGDVARILPYDGSSYKDLAIGDYGGGNPNIMLKVGGNVGIATGTPQNTFNVAGDGNFTGDLFVNEINISANNASLVNYIAVVNTSMNNYVDYQDLTYNTSVVNHINLNNASMGNYVVDYVGIQNTSLVNYISTVNTSNNNYIVDYVGIQNTSLVNYIAANNASMGSTFVPYTGANQNINLGNNNFSVNSTFYVNTNNGGRVGVGTSAPTRNFHILTDGDTTGLDTQIYIQQSGSRDAAIQLKVASTDWTFGADNSDGDSFKIANGINLANSPALTIDTSERVGIGTTSPGSLLTVAQVATTNEINLSNTLFVNSTAGNVGIGTSAPEQLLHLVGSTNPKLYIEDSTNNVQIVAGATNTLGILGTQSAHPLSIRTGNAEAMYIDTSGQVGIGTAVPATKVEIYDSADSRLRLRSDVNENTTIDFMESTGDGDRDGFRAYYQGFDNVFNLFGVVNDVETSGISILRDSGNVGMGTTSPSFKLDVDGNFALNKTATNRLILPLNNDAATPTISFGDGDSGFYEVSDDLIGISIGGGRKWNIDSDELEGDTFGSSPRLFQGDVSSTVPQFSFNSDINTGFARAAADKISLITGGIAALFIDDSQKVGIGTITPQTELDVVGDINVTGTVNVGNTGSMRIDENGDMIFRI